MPEYTAPTLISPNSVLANALLRTIDMIRPRVQAMRPQRIEFVVGTQINGAPHLGTNLVQSSAFLLAQQARRAFRTDTAVRFSALDNAPYDITLDPETHHAYQQTYFHALGKDGVADLGRATTGPSSTPCRTPPTWSTSPRPTATSRPAPPSGLSSCAPWRRWTTSSGG